MTEYKYQVAIQINHLRAVRLFTATKNTKQYLCGVAIKNGYLIGANDHYIGAIKYTDVLTGLPELIIPNTQIDFYLKKTKRAKIGIVVIEWNDDKKGRMTDGDNEERFIGVDGLYPDITRVFPTHTKAGESAQFQWSYLTVFEKAAIELGVCKNEPFKASLLPNGTDTAWVMIPGYPEFVGVLMPMRLKPVSNCLVQIDYGSAIEKEEIL